MILVTMMVDRPAMHGDFICEDYSNATVSWGEMDRIASSTSRPANQLNREK